MKNGLKSFVPKVVPQLWMPPNAKYEQDYISHCENVQNKISSL